MAEKLGAPDEAKIVHNIVRLPESATSHDRHVEIQVRALLSLVASEVAS